MREHNYFSLFLITVLSSIFCIIFSCSDSSKDSEEDDENPDTINLHQPSLLQNSKDRCLVGWDIHPYKECSQESFGIKSYKELRTEVCGVESKTKGCKKCSDVTFGVKTVEPLTRFSKQIERIVSYKLTPIETSQYCNAITRNYIDELKEQFKPSSFTIQVSLEKCSLEIPQRILLHLYDKDNKGDTKIYTVVTTHNVIIDKILEYNEKEDCRICGTQDITTYKLCRHPSHGVEEYNSQVSKECGINVDVITRSKNTSSRQDVQDTEGEILGCKTCDDISFDSSNMDETNQKALIDKINCLLNNLEQLDTQDSTRFFIISELKQLYTYSDLINQIDPNLLNRMKENI